MFFGRAVIMMCMIMSQKGLKVSHKNQFSAPSNVRLVESFMGIGCQTCVIFEGPLYPQKIESVTTATIAASEGLIDRIKKLAPSTSWA